MFTYVEAAGCTNTCRHCASEGKPPYGGFFSVAELRGLVADGWQIYPYYEASAHPEYPELLAPDICAEGGDYHSTNGWGIARAEDPERLFARLREFGWRWLSLTLHGLEEHHDWFVARKGAYADIVRASELGRANGFGLHWNIMLDNRNLEQMPALLEVSREMTGSNGWLCLANHHANRRMWRYEALRPSLADVRRRLAPWIAEEVWKTSDGGRIEPERMTEAYWLGKWREAAASGEGLDRFDVGVEPRPVLKITRQRQVFITDPPPIALLGELSEGREVLEERARRHAATPLCETPPPEAGALEGSDLLHPCGASVRMKAISLVLRELGR
jgi:hypothetical protein